MTDIAITGIGIISALGIGREAFWQSLRNATSGIKKITSFDTGGLRSNIAACVDDFDPRGFLPSRIFRRMSRISQMAVVSSLEAIEDSGIDLKTTNKDNMAVIMGTAYGSSASVEAFYTSFLAEGPRGAQPFFFPETVPNAPASHIAMFHGITGPNTTFCQNGISAENAILYARTLLLTNQADVVLVGGADELTQILYTCYNVFHNRAKVKDGEPANPIFGGGLVLGEGAGMLVMERRESALDRGATIYGILKSGAICGGTAAIGHYETQGEQMARAMTLAADQAGVGPGTIDHINVSANFSKELDRMEYDRLCLFLEKWKTERTVTPLKYLMGDFGGAGVIRAAAILLSLRHQVPLPTVEAKTLLRETQDPAVWQISQQGSPQTAIMTSSTFGGGSASMVFTKN